MKCIACFTIVWLMTMTGRGYTGKCWHECQASLFYLGGAGMAHPIQASHQCGAGAIPGLSVMCGLSLSLVLVLAPRGFSPGSPVLPSPQKPPFPNSNSIWDLMATCLSVVRLLHVSVTLVEQS